MALEQTWHAALLLIMFTNLYKEHSVAVGFEMQSFYNRAKHMYSDSRGSIFSSCISIQYMIPLGGLLTQFLFSWVFTKKGNEAMWAKPGRIQFVKMPSLTDERLVIVHLNNLVTKLRQIGANALNCLDDRNMVNVR